MKRRKLVWHLFPSYLLLVVATLAAVSWYAIVALTNFHYDQTTLHLEALARVLVERLGPDIASRPPDDINSISADLAERAGVRVTAILPDGVVIADSHKDPLLMENHADRPEIIAAYTGQVGSARRFSHTLQHRRVYAAVPVMRNRGVVAVVRTSVPTTAVESEIALLLRPIGLAALMMILLAAVLSFFVSRRIARPLENMERGATRFARGELQHDLPVPKAEELASLAESLNAMAAELDVRIRTISHQRAESEAVFSSMVEGVIAVDPGERIIAINLAAADMFAVDAARSRGRLIQEVIRNTDVQNLARRALESDGPVEAGIDAGAGGERYLQAHGTALRDGQGRQVGAVLVLNDMTRMRRLENVRRDFVANVSHELRTPITSIKGFVETLIDGECADPKETRRFLDIVLKHVDRLNAIIEDLLYLSRIEQDPEHALAGLREVVIREIVEHAIDALAASARERDIRIEVGCERSIKSVVNAQLIEHAVANLLDNAIKYSEPGTTVWVEGEDVGNEVRIRVRDEGVGIAPEHLERIFERFYRVDKARSRRLGGTGLGLAIAKHIIQAHGGRILVDSEPGEGSVFTIVLPKQRSSGIR
jgi:two-component system phosphate regulon sensor histidine kinase PhoR